MLEEVLLLGDHFYESSTRTESSVLRERHLHNPESVTVIIAFDRKTGTRSVVGFYALLPLTKRGTEAVQAGRIEGSKHLRADDVSRTFTRFEGLYVSAVFAANHFARAATTNWLLSEILEQKDRRPALKLVFARPTTPEGKAIFKDLTGREAILGEVQIIDLENKSIRDRYMERAASGLRILVAGGGLGSLLQGRRHLKGGTTWVRRQKQKHQTRS